MDLFLDLEITSPKTIAHVNERRQAHEAQQQNPAGIAAATPGQIKLQWPHSINSARTDARDRDQHSRNSL